MTEKKAPYVVPSTSGREKLIAILVGVLILVAVLGGVLTMGNRVAGQNLTGTIILKTEEAVQEQELTIGKKSFSTRSIEAKYVLEVDVNGKVYLVPVTKKVYEAKKIGDKITFSRPKD